MHKDLTTATETLLKHYTKGIVKDNKQITEYSNHKLRHSNGVLAIGRQILLGKEFDNIPFPLKEKAEICFLLHDLGRFYQHNKDRVLSSEEFQHGDAGYQILLKENYSDDIALATKYHDKLSVEGYKQEKIYITATKKKKDDITFLIKVLRDADKLENLLYILFSFEKMMKIDFNRYPEGSISQAVYKEFIKKSLVTNKNRKTQEDYLVSMLSWTFDINFQATGDILDYYNFTGNIIKKLEQRKGITKEEIKAIKLTFLNG